jgi:signal transduction histidine kinase
MMQYSQHETSNGERLAELIARLAETPSEEAIHEAIGNAAEIVGARRLMLSSTEGPASGPNSNDLFLLVEGTSRHLVASFDAPPSRFDIERLRSLSAAISLALRLSDQKRETERARYHVTMGRAVAGVLHDIANPLNALLLSIESAHNGVDVKEAVDDALRSARLMLTTLDRLRRFTGGIDSRLMPIDVAGAIAAALRVSAFETKGLAEIVVRVTPGLAISARPGELEHVLVNLLINAAHALAGLGGFHHRITVSAFATQGDVVIDVHDTGPGIATEHLGRLFDEGFTTKSARHGSGLGLSLCRDIVTRLGGTIEVKAPRELGTRVTVRLPAAPSIPGAAPVVTNDVHPAIPRVLIVDSDALITRAVGRALDRVATIATSSSTADALALVERERFDLIVCEHCPPHVDALALRRAQALRWPERATGVVLMIVDPYLELPPGTRVITKPIDLGALKALVAEATSNNT